MTGTLNAGALDNYGQAVLDAGPTGYYRLESNADVVPDTADALGPPQDGAQNAVYQDVPLGDRGVAGPRPGDLVNGLPLLGFAADNNATEFHGDIGDNDAVVLAADDGNLNVGAGGAFSVEAWVKAPPTGPGSEGNGWDGHGIVTKGFGNGDESFCLDVTGDGYRFYGWTDDPAVPHVAQSTVKPNSTWQHLVGTGVAGGEMRVYVNGVLAGSTAAQPTLRSNDHDVSIGSRQGHSNPEEYYNLSFLGLIDEVAVYDYALSANEVGAHFAAAFEPVPEPSTLMLALVGLIGLVGFARRRRRA